MAVTRSRGGYSVPDARANKHLARYQAVINMLIAQTVLVLKPTAANRVVTETQSLDIVAVERQRSALSRWETLCEHTERVTQMD